MAAASSKGEPHTTQSAVLQPFHQYDVAYTFWGSVESHVIPLPSLHGREGSSHPGFSLSIDRVDCKSLISIKPGDSGAVIGCQVEEFTWNWSAEYFVFQSHIYPGSQVRCQHYSTSHLNQGVRIILCGPSSYRFWAWSCFHPHWLHQNTRTWCISWQTWYCDILSLFRFPMLSYYHFWLF